MSLVYSSVANTVAIYCEAGAVEQPVHHHLVCREYQERLLYRYTSRCIDLLGRNVTLDLSPVDQGPEQVLNRSGLHRRLDAYILGDARKKPPVLLLESPRYCGKTSTLAQWVTGRHDPFVSPGGLAQINVLRDYVDHEKSRHCTSRRVIVFLFAAAMSIEEVLVYLAIEVALQWRGCSSKDGRVHPEVFDGRFDALLSAKSSQASVAACAQALRQTLLQVPVLPA